MLWYEAFFLFYLPAVNLFTLVLFGIDKLFAIRKHFRISEAMLLSVTLLGGAAGALIGMVLFHHKISKPKFRYFIPFLFVVSFTLLLLYLFQAVWGSTTL